MQISSFFHLLLLALMGKASQRVLVQKFSLALILQPVKVENAKKNCFMKKKWKGLTLTARIFRTTGNFVTKTHSEASPIWSINW